MLSSTPAVSLVIKCLNIILFLAIRYSHISPLTFKQLILYYLRNNFKIFIYPFYGISVGSYGSKYGSVGIAC